MSFLFSATANPQVWVMTQSLGSTDGVKTFMVCGVFATREKAEKAREEFELENHHPDAPFELKIESFVVL